jgi:hypothetical protein
VVLDSGSFLCGACYQEAFEASYFHAQSPSEGDENRQVNGAGEAAFDLAIVVDISDDDDDSSPTLVWSPGDAADDDDSDATLIWSPSGDEGIELRGVLSATEHSLTRCAFCGRVLHHGMFSLCNLCYWLGHEAHQQFDAAEAGTDEDFSEVSSTEAPDTDAGSLSEIEEEADEEEEAEEDAKGGYNAPMPKKAKREM